MLKVKSALLQGLSEGPACGSELKQRLAGHGVEVTDGSLYPVLAQLAEEGLAASLAMPSAAGRKRNVFSLTDAGSQLAEKERAGLMAWLFRLDA
jgi:PadR family transcriptional regulator PadR